MISIGDRVRINLPASRLDGASGEVVRVRVIEPRAGLMSSHMPISHLFTVRLDDGTLVEPPLLISDLVVVSRERR